MVTPPPRYEQEPCAEPVKNADLSSISPEILILVDFMNVISFHKLIFDRKSNTS